MMFLTEFFFNIIPYSYFRSYFCLHIFNTKYTLRLIWYDQITLRIQETDMLYKGDTLYLDWLEDGIAELVFDAPGSVNKLDTATVASLGEAIGVLEQQSDLKAVDIAGPHLWTGGKLQILISIRGLWFRHVKSALTFWSKSCTLPAAKPD